MFTRNSSSTPCLARTQSTAKSTSQPSDPMCNTQHYSSFIHYATLFFHSFTRWWLENGSEAKECQMLPNPSLMLLVLPLPQATCRIETLGAGCLMDTCPFSPQLIVWFDEECRALGCRIPRDGSAFLVTFFGGVGNVHNNGEVPWEKPPLLPYPSRSGFLKKLKVLLLLSAPNSVCFLKRNQLHRMA